MPKQRTTEDQGRRFAAYAEIVPTKEGQPKKVRVVASTTNAMYRGSFYDGKDNRVAIYETVINEPDALDVSYLDSGNAPALIDHENSFDAVVGTIDKGSVSIADGKTSATITMLDDPKSEAAYNKIKAGVGNTSIGYASLKEEVKAANDERIDITVKKAKINEISFVGVQANPQAGVTMVASLKDRLTTLKEEKMPDAAEAEAAAAKESVDTKEEQPVQRAASASVSTNDVQKAVEQRMAQQGEMVKWSEDYEDQLPGIKAEVSEMALKGSSFSDVKEHVTTRLAKSLEEMADGTARKKMEIGATDKEVSKFSIAALAMAEMHPNSKEWQLAAGLSKEMSEEARRVQGNNGDRSMSGGYRIPIEYFDQKMAGSHAMAEYMRKAEIDSQTGTGANLTQEVYMAQNFIEYLRHQSVWMQTGLTMLTGPRGDVKIPRQLTGVTSGWVGTQRFQNDIQDKDATFDTLEIKPKEAMVLSSFTPAADAQSLPMIDGLIRADQAAATRELIDTAIPQGNTNTTTGADLNDDKSPDGILQFAAFQSGTVDADGSPVSEAFLFELDELLGDAKYNPQEAVDVFNWKVWRKMSETRPTGDGDSSTRRLYNNELATRQVFGGHTAYISGNMGSAFTRGNTATSTSSYIRFIPRMLYMVEWAGVDVLVDPFSNRKKNVIEISLLRLLNWAPRYENAFVGAKLGITTT